MFKLTTDADLLRRLREASQKHPTAEELHHQRVSFILSSFDDALGMTRAKVEKVLSLNEGRQPDK